MEKSIAVFRGKEIRKTIHNNEWWFVIVDVVSALTDSINPSGYIKDMRRRDKELSKGWGQIATPLSVQTEGGLELSTLCRRLKLQSTEKASEAKNCKTKGHPRITVFPFCLPKRLNWRENGWK